MSEEAKKRIEKDRAMLDKLREKVEARITGIATSIATSVARGELEEVARVASTVVDSGNNLDHSERMNESGKEG